MASRFLLPASPPWPPRAARPGRFLLRADGHEAPPLERERPRLGPRQVTLDGGLGGTSLCDRRARRRDWVARAGCVCGCCCCGRGRKRNEEGIFLADLNVVGSLCGRGAETPRRRAAGGEQLIFSMPPPTWTALPSSKALLLLLQSACILFAFVFGRGKVNELKKKKARGRNFLDKNSPMIHFSRPLELETRKSEREKYPSLPLLWLTKPLSNSPPSPGHPGARQPGGVVGRDAAPRSRGGELKKNSFFPSRSRSRSHGLPPWSIPSLFLSSRSSNSHQNHHESLSILPTTLSTRPTATMMDTPRATTAALRRPSLLSAAPAGAPPRRCCCWPARPASGGP